MINPANMDQKAQAMLLELEEEQRKAIDKYVEAKQKLKEATQSLSWAAERVSETTIELRKFVHAHGG